MTSSSTASAATSATPATASASASTGHTDTEMASLQQRLESFLEADERISWQEYSWCADPQQQNQEDSALYTVRGKR